MDPSKLKVEIVTNHGVVYRGEAEGLVAPGLDGYFGVLPRHAPLIAALGVGEVRVRHGDQWDRYALSGGIMHVRDREAVIMAEAAEHADRIDVERARAALARAQERLRSGHNGPDTDVARAQLALARAMNRLMLAGPGIDS